MLLTLTKYGLGYILRDFSQTNLVTLVSQNDRETERERERCVPVNGQATTEKTKYVHSRVALVRQAATADVAA
jgi:hypothetical protein